MGAFKKFRSKISRPFKAVKRIGTAIGGMFKKAPGEVAEAGSELWREARSRAAGAGLVNYTEEGRG